MLTKKNFVIVGSVTLALVICYSVFSVVTVNLALTARASEIGLYPDQFGLSYEDIEFSPRGDESITLRGWWIPASDDFQPEVSKGTVIGVHGLDGNRENLLEMAPSYIGEGFSFLIFDLRGHGMSDKAPMGAGLKEIQELQGAIDFVVLTHTPGPGGIFLHGLSYGAAIVLLTGHNEVSVGGVFSDSSFASLTDLVVQEVADRTYLPLWGASLFRPGLVRAAKVMKGLDLDKVLPAEAAGEYTYPIALVHCKSDQRIKITHLAQIRAQVQEPPCLVAYLNCDHSNARFDHAEHYNATALSYFNSRIEGDLE